MPTDLIWVLVIIAVVAAVLIYLKVKKGRKPEQPPHLY